MDTATIDRMAKKKKPTGGKHKVPRQPMMIPAPWMALVRKLAAKRQQPSVWFVLSIVGELAEKEGIDRPSYPWEEGDE
jgi:hypothetical protein